MIGLSESLRASVIYFTTNTSILLKKISAAIFVRGLGAISAFVMSAAIARQLPVEEAGYFFLAFSTVSILYPASLFGSQTASLRFIGAAYAEKKWDSIQGISVSTRIIVVISSAIFSSLLLAFSPVLVHDIWKKTAMEPILLNILLISSLMSVSALIAHHLQAISKTISSIIILSILIPLGTAFLIVLWHTQTANEAVMWLTWMAMIDLIVSYLLWRVFSTPAKPKYPDIKILLTTCIPLWLVTVMSSLTQWGGQIIAGAWVDAEEIAYLAMAQRTAMLVSFFLISINMVIAPHFAAFHKQGKTKDLKRLAIQSVRMMMAFSIPTISILVFFSEFVMSIFGEKFISGSHLLIILAIGQLINAITGSVGYLLTMSGHEKDMRNVIMVSSSVTILLSLILCSKFGITGAACATALGVSIQNLGAIWLVRKRFGFNMLIFWQSI